MFSLVCLYCRNMAYAAVFYDIIESKPVKKGSKKMVPFETIGVGLVGPDIGKGNIWWAEHTNLQQNSGRYVMLHVLGSSDPLIDPLPSSGFLLEVPLGSVSNVPPDEGIFYVAEIKISKEQWKKAKQISKGPSFLSCFFLLDLCYIELNQSSAGIVDPEVQKEAPSSAAPENAYEKKRAANIARNNAALRALQSSVDPSLLPKPPVKSSSLACPAGSDSEFSPSDDSGDSSDEPLEKINKDSAKKQSKMKSVLSPSKSPQKKKQRTRKKKTPVKRSSKNQRKPAAARHPPPPPKADLQAYAASFPVHQKPTEQVGTNSNALLNRLLTNMAAVVPRPTVPAVEVSPPFPVVPPTTSLAGSIPVSHVSGGKKSTRGKKRAGPGVNPAVFQLGPEFQHCANLAWEQPVKDTSVKQSAVEGAVKVAEGHSIDLAEADYVFIRQCIGVPLANRNAKLNKSIRNTPVTDKAPTFDVEFVNGVFPSKVAVFLPPIDVIRRGFRMRQGRLDVSHAQTYIYRHFFFATQPKATSFEIGQVNMVRFRGISPGGGSTGGHVRLLAELQRATTVDMLCKYYGLDPFLPTGGPVEAPTVTGAVDKAATAAVVAPAYVAHYTTPEYTVVAPTAESTLTNSRVATVLGGLTDADVQELRRQLFEQSQ